MQLIAPDANAEQFFKEISDSINLEDLYYIEDSCSLSHQDLYFPILLRIKNEELLKFYDNQKYIVQVWDKERKIVFEHRMNNYAENEEKIIFFLNDGAVTKIKNLLDHNQYTMITAYQGLDIIIANSTEILITRVTEVDSELKDSYVDGKTLEIRKIFPKLKLLGMFIKFFIFETEDNQLEFFTLNIKSFDHEKFEYVFSQVISVMPRYQEFNDPIVKIVNVEFFNLFQTLALRKSGKCDIYKFNQRMNEIQNVVDIGQTHTGLYVKVIENQEPVIYGIDIFVNLVLDFNNFEKVQKGSLKFDRLFLENIKRYVKFCTNLVYFTVNNIPYIALNHRDILSIYDIFNKTWIKHFQIGKISFMDVINKSNNQQLVILVDNGFCYSIDLKYFVSAKELPLHQHELKGKIRSCCFSKFGLVALHEIADKQSQLTVLALVQDPQDWKKLIVQPFESGIELEKSKFQSIIKVQSFNDKVYVVVQLDKKFQFYQIGLNKFNLILTYEDANIKEINSIRYDHDQNSLLVFSRSSTIDKTNNSWNNDDYNNSILSVISIENRNIKLQVEIPNCSRVFFYSDQIIYTVSKDLMILDLSELNTNSSFTQMHLKSKDIIKGNETIYYCQSEQRFAYLHNFTKIKVCPLLHTNEINLIGFQPTKTLAYKTIDNKVIQFNSDGFLMTWNIITGKFIGKVAVEDDWIPKYKLHSFQGRNENQQIFVISTINQIPSTEWAIDDYFPASILVKHLDNCELSLAKKKNALYEYKIVEIIDEKSFRVIKRFKWTPADSQSFYLSEDFNYLIEKSGNFQYLWKSQQISQDELKWTLIKQLNSFDTRLVTGQNKFLGLYSNDFSRYLKVNKKQRMFSICDTITDEQLAIIPDYIMAYDEKEKLATFVNRLFWINNTTLKYVNKEGIETVFSIEGEVKIQGFNKIPLFEEIDSNLDNYQYYYQQKELKSDQIEQRLQRKYQQYKSLSQLDNIQDPNQLQFSLNNINWNIPGKTNLSFTYLNWNLIEKICEGKVKLQDLKTQIIKQLVYNILPGGNTILHKLCQNGQTQELQYLFQLSVVENTIQIHIPFLKNFQSQTPLHISVEQEDFNTISEFLTYLSYYGIDHHSMAIRGLIPYFISNEVASILPYLQTRIQTTTSLKSIQRMRVNQNDIPLLPTSLILHKDQIIGQLSQQKENEKRIECQYLDMPLIFDCNDQYYEELFEVLSQTQMSDTFSLESIRKIIEYNYRIMQKHLVFKQFFPFTSMLVIFLVFIHKIKVEYNQLSLGDNQQMHAASIVLLCFLFILATYFIQNEIRQIVKSRLSYFLSVWNCIDVLLILGIYLYIGLCAFSENYDNIQYVVQAMISFFLWLKFFYYFRMFKSTGYLIRAIIKVLIDIRHFLLVLIIAILAWTDPFLSLSYPNEEEDQYVTTYIKSISFVYRMILGDWDSEAFGQVHQPLVWILFVTCTVFNTIILLNLLIAIISESFAQVQGSAENAAYQEMASLIYENIHYIQGNNDKRSQINQFLFITSYVESKEIMEKTLVERRIDELEIQLQQFKQEMNSQIITQTNLVKQLQDNILKELKLIKKD